MAKSGRKSDWWETMLYLGLFLLIALFLYQLLQLWNKGVATATNGYQTLSQALSNTLASIETGFANLVTAPATFFSNLFMGFPNLLNLLISFVSSLAFGDIITNLLSWAGSIFGGILNLFSTSGTAPITSGAGANASFSNTDLIPSVDQTSPGFPSIGGSLGNLSGGSLSGFSLDTSNMSTTD